MKKRHRWLIIFCLPSLFFAGFPDEQAKKEIPLTALLPEIPGWKVLEALQTFHPATLFEYINGAAEGYIAYAFEELVVAHYERPNPRANLTLEIYEMGTGRNAFGIYSVERSPESQFLSIGSEGYYEAGTLNFIAGSKYIKLFCPDCGEEDERILRQFARSVEAKIPNQALPVLLSVFPRDGLIARSEKFIRQNVFGYSFLHDGFLASYQVNGQDFELFLIEADDETKAGEMMRRYLDAQEKNGQIPKAGSQGFHFRDRYAKNVFITQAGHLILGVRQINDGWEELGQEYLQALIKNIKGSEGRQESKPGGFQERG